MGGGDSAFRRRLERGAELRSHRGAGFSAEEETHLEAAEESGRQERRKVDDAKRVEYLIRDAMAQGKFDNLKYTGKPIPDLGEAYDPDWWVKGLIQRENISGLGPKAILLRAEDAGLDARLDGQFTEKQVRDILKDFNARVIDARRQLQGGPPVITRTRDVEDELARWHERRAARTPSAPPAPRPRRRNRNRNARGGNGCGTALDSRMTTAALPAVVGHCQAILSDISLSIARRCGEQEIFHLPEGPCRYERHVREPQDCRK